MKSVVRIGTNSKGKDLAEAATGDRPRIDARAELIQALIPIGLEAVNELLQQEVVSLVGARVTAAAAAKATMPDGADSRDRSISAITRWR